MLLPLSHLRPSPVTFARKVITIKQKIESNFGKLELHDIPKIHFCTTRRDEVSPHPTRPSYRGLPSFLPLSSSSSTRPQPPDHAPHRPQILISKVLRVPLLSLLLSLPDPSPWGSLGEDKHPTRIKDVVSERRYTNLYRREPPD